MSKLSDAFPEQFMASFHEHYTSSYSKQRANSVPDQYVAYLTPRGHAAINLDIYHVKSGNNCYKSRQSDFISNIPSLLNNLPTFCKENVKLFIINLFEFDHPNYPNNIEFCQKLRKLLERNKKKYYFVTNEIMDLTSILPKQLTLSFYYQSNAEYPQLLITMVIDSTEINITDLQKKSESTKLVILNRRKIEIQKEYDIEKIYKEIVGNLTPYRFIAVKNKTATNCDSFIEELKKSFHEKKIFLEYHPERKIFDVVTKMSKSSYENGKFFITRQTCKTFMIGKMNSIANRPHHKNDTIIQVNPNQNIHYRLIKECYTSRSHRKLYIGILNSDSETCQMLPSEEIYKVACHYVYVSLRIDEHNNPTLYQEPKNSSLISYFPEDLTRRLTTKVPAIGFFNNFSVICLWNDQKNCYEFSKNWNGMYGKDLFLSFGGKKPKLTDKYANNRSFIVYDLLKIMSMPQSIDKIVVDPDWGFDITSDEKNPVLLEFDTLNEGRSVASPSFLMAICLKQHLKSIKKETGKKCEEIVVKLFDTFRTEEDRLNTLKLMGEIFNLIKLRVPNLFSYPVKIISPPADTLLTNQKASADT